MKTTMALLAGFAGLTMTLTSAPRKSRHRCPTCGAPLPRVSARDARSRWWAGWICRGCGSEIDRRGRKVA